MMKEEYQKYMEEIVKGVFTGILSFYLLFYGLRPSVQYPDFILDFFENKWVFMILFIIMYYVMIWDYRSGVLMLLATFSLIFDYTMFARNDNDEKTTTKPVIIQTPLFI